MDNGPSREYPSHSLRRKRTDPSSPSQHLHPTNRTVWKRQKTISTSITINTDLRPSISNHRWNWKQNLTRSRTDAVRHWNFSSHDSSRFKDKVVIVSYNILGVTNASMHINLYSRVSRQFLNWNRRKLLIREELSRYRPGIICFQEVDRFSDLAELLRDDGFEGIHKARTGEACDGCAIFWKKELFTLLHHDSIEFREFDLRNNVAQFCVLKVISESNNNLECPISQTPSLVVGNIHALFNPKRGDIKLGQIRLLVEKAHRISQEWGEIPVVIAGDLNCTPESAIYQFLASSELDILGHDRRKLSGQLEGPARWRPFTAHTEVSQSWSKEELQIASGSESNTHLHHHLELRSAYVGVPGSSSTRDRHGEPLATTHHSEFMGTVDYIWHSKELVPIGVVETLPVHMLRQMGGLPSQKWGSDHLALVCELAFTDDSNET